MRPFLLIGLLLTSTAAFSAIPATSVFEVRSSGDDTNAGGFDSAGSGTDYSLQAAANPNGGNDGSSVLAAANGTTTLTCSDCNFTTAITGNIAWLSGGTGSIAKTWRRLTYASATTVTMDALIAASTGMTIRIGGAFATPSQAALAANVNQATIFIKNDGAVFITTTSATNVSSGTVNMTKGLRIAGYSTNRTFMNSDPAPTYRIGTGAGASTLFSGNTTSIIRNLILDGNSQGSSVGVGALSSVFVDSVTFINFTGTADAAAITTRSKAYNNSNTSFGGNCYDCEAYSNTSNAFSSNICIKCLAYNNTGATSNGILNSAPGLYVDCVLSNNGQDGINAVSGNNAFVVNTVSMNNGRNGYNFSNGEKVLFNSAYVGNVSGNSIPATVGVESGTVSISTDPFVNSASGNFTLNSTAGGGGSLMTTGFPNASPTNNTLSYPDVGFATRPNPSMSSAQ